MHVNDHSLSIVPWHFYQLSLWPCKLQMMQSQLPQECMLHALELLVMGEVNVSKWTTKSSNVCTIRKIQCICQLTLNQFARRTTFMSHYISIIIQCSYFSYLTQKKNTWTVQFILPTSANTVELLAVATSRVTIYVFGAS